jgi:hypothetical protein
MESKFTIDFFEFSFLVEACIPPVPIARTMFWHNVIDKYYYQMIKEERFLLYEWIKKNPHFNVEKEKDCAIFEARFNPDNQYLVHTDVEGSKGKIKTFLYKDRYHTSMKTSISEEFITKIEKIDE